MSASILLEPTLKSILVVLKPTQEDWLERFRAIDELREIVHSVESLRGATVEPFGSFVSRLFTRWGDLDISINLAMVLVFHQLVKGLKRVYSKIFSTHSKEELIENARVPIVKVNHIRNNKISCDISIDNLIGQIKSKMLFWMNEIDGRFHDMVLLVKEWAKARNMNNSRFGSFNSYSLCLLVIFHFQTCVPVIFPPLKDIYPGNIVDDLRGARVDAERRISETCAANIARFRANRARLNSSSLSELLLSFLAKFSEINSTASEFGICVYTGKWERIQSNTRWLPKTSAILVEDPFQQPENTTRSVSSRNLFNISNAFTTSYYRLRSYHPTRDSLLAEVASPRTSNLVLQSSAETPNFSNGFHQRAPAWAPNQFQSGRPGSHAGSSSSSRNYSRPYY